MSIHAISWCIDQKDLPPGEWVVLFHLCHCHNHETGRCDPSQEYLAEQTGMGIRTVRRHLASLEKKSKILRKSRGTAHGGRLSDFYILGHEPAKLAANLTGQSMHSKRPIHAQNMHELAAKQEVTGKEQGNTPLAPKGADAVSPDVEVDHSEVPSRGLVSDQFQEFWDTYPHRGGVKKNRKGAEAKFQAALKRGVTVDQIMAGVSAMQSDPAVQRGFARDPVTWINQEGWNDEHDPQPFCAAGSAVSARQASASDAYRRILDAAAKARAPSPDDIPFG